MLMPPKSQLNASRTTATAPGSSIGRLEELGAVVEPLHQVQAMHTGTRHQLGELQPTLNEGKGRRSLPSWWRRSAGSERVEVGL